ncbi:Mn2+/Fe2+ NRAMP family transporter [Ornithinimicrobium humiphilum]|uniref:Mn2+/Fe2+ NRAMP family transporter n=1 Tax=Ornithinimicrobium humiphilum TaxID=125288 RepID=A0A543KM41_9MICO|nr:NRAMP family divalent metal transporter [Ornithinimicrobium humiphilum]TQM96153.1 Mn2+/Fe2+ NRAMP family transporter [Ornithinimicrobium humiphilum]
MPDTPDPAPRADAPPQRTATGRGTLLGAIFLMATSSIGPGFITQTTSFTVQLGAAFAFAILVSILVDIAIQTNVWRVIGISGMRAQELGNATLPGLGYVMAGMLLVGGIVFNIGNVSGAGLGMNIMTDLDVRIGAVILAALAVGIFLSKRAGIAMDRVVVVLGAVMIALTLYIALTSGPPVGAALRNTVMPETIEPLAITTLIGGTIGGYIIYAGVHRLLDAGVSGPGALRQLTRGAVTGIVVTGIMRVILFLAILGVVSTGADLDPDRQAASAFEAAAGAVGYRLFGVVFAAAALTSVIGVSYTTITFLTSRTRTAPRTTNYLVVGFIALSTVLYLVIGAAPAQLLVFAGAFNGILLPVGIGVMLWVAWRRRDLLQGYDYPKWLAGIGTVAWLVTIYLAFNSVRPAIELVTG